MEGILMFRGNKNSILAIKNANKKKSEAVVKSVIGKYFSTNKDGIAKVIDGKQAQDLTIQFVETGNIRYNVDLANLRCGKVKDILKKSTVPTVFGVGYAPLKKKADKHIYKVWCNMLARCYDKQRINGRDKSYAQCVVCEGWLHYDNFESWYMNNKLNGCESFIDKDLLSPNCKIYSPSTCVMLPREINNALQRTEKNKKDISRDLPRGVQRNSKGQIFAMAHHKYLGIYNNVETAFKAYKVAKEAHLRYLAYKYKAIISNIAYNALLNYEVEQ